MSDSTGQSNRHSPEPWELNGPGIFAPDYSAGKDHIYDVATVSYVMYEEGRANARRIVACVNGCAGINPEAVPELVEACRDLIEYVGLDTDEPVELPRWRFDAINAALANVKGGVA